MMTLEEMRLAVCKKLPELIVIGQLTGKPVWKSQKYWEDGHIINWPTEGLQVCHEAEKKLGGQIEQMEYVGWLHYMLTGTPLDVNCTREDDIHILCNATYEQRLEALCRVWFPERF